MLIFVIIHQHIPIYTDYVIRTTYIYIYACVASYGHFKPRSLPSPRRLAFRSPFGSLFGLQSNVLMTPGGPLAVPARVLRRAALGFGATAALFTGLTASRHGVELDLKSRVNLKSFPM